MRFSQLNHLQCLRLAGCLVTSFLVAGCATRKTTPPPPVIYPAEPETALREMRQLPAGPYDRLEVITVTAEVGEQLASAIKSARQIAAQKGANALVVLEDTEFLQRAGKRTLRVRGIIYLAIHRR